MAKVRDAAVVLLYLGAGLLGAAGYLADAIWFLPAFVCTGLLFIVARERRHARQADRSADEDGAPSAKM